MDTTVGVGVDLVTVMGSFDAGDNDWEKSPMGKALKKAAGKVAEETARRAGSARSER